MITISRDHITLLHKMGKKQSREKATKMLYIWDSPNVENNWIHLCNMWIFHCVTASVKYLMEQEKQECIPEEKEKQVNLTCWTALPWWCFLHAALLLAAPHRWQRRAPWVQRLSSVFRQVRNIFGDTTKGAESKNNSFQWRMSLSKFPYRDIIKYQMMLAASKRSSVNINHCF